MTPAAMFGRFLLITGVVLVLLGVLLIFAGRIPLLGKLPGDIVIARRNFTLYLPITTSIVLSGLLSLILWFLTRR